MWKKGEYPQNKRSSGRKFWAKGRRVHARVRTQIVSRCGLECVRGAGAKVERPEHQRAGKKLRTWSSLIVSSCSRNRRELPSAADADTTREKATLRRVVARADTHRELFRRANHGFFGFFTEAYSVPVSDVFALSETRPSRGRSMQPKMEEDGACKVVIVVHCMCIISALEGSFFSNGNTESLWESEKNVMLARYTFFPLHQCTVWRQGNYSSKID